MSIILGGYIGATITGVLASFYSLSVSVYLLAFAFIGIAMTFIGMPLIKNIGETLCGFGLLFIGLAVMKSSFQNVDINNFCKTLFTNLNFQVVLYLLGVILAGLAQSSSAITGIVIAMAARI